MGTTDPSSFPPLRTPCSLVLFLPYLVQQVQYVLSVVVDRHQQGRRGDDRRAGGMVFQGRADSPVSGDAGHGLVMGTAFHSSVHLLHTLTCSRSVNQKRLIVKCIKLNIRLTPIVNQLAETNVKFCFFTDYLSHWFDNVLGLLNSVLLELRAIELTH